MREGEDGRYDFGGGDHNRWLRGADAFMYIGVLLQDGDHDLADDPAVIYLHLRLLETSQPLQKLTSETRPIFKVGRFCLAKLSCFR